MKPLTTLKFSIFLLITACTSNSGQRNISSADFSGKAFRMFIEESAEASHMNDIESMVIFNNDTTGVFRSTKGSMLKHIDFTWKFIGDSLRIKKVDSIPIGEKYPHLYQTPPMTYFVTKQSNELLLKGKKDQLLLSPQ